MGGGILGGLLGGMLFSSLGFGGTGGGFGGTGIGFIEIMLGDVQKEPRKIVVNLGQGQIIGEMSLVDLGPRSATARAAVDEILGKLTAPAPGKPGLVPFFWRGQLPAHPGPLFLGGRGRSIQTEHSQSIGSVCPMSIPEDVLKVKEVQQ